MTPFSIARLPRIEFGAGALKKLPDIIASYGARILLVTGAHSFINTPHWQFLIDQLERRGITWQHCTVAEEPSPALIDELVKAHAGDHFTAIAGIGGGSALDAAKAVAGLLQVQRSVMDYLEGVGPELPYQGPAVPFIAVPTTAGIPAARRPKTPCSACKVKTVSRNLSATTNWSPNMPSSIRIYSQAARPA